MDFPRLDLDAARTLGESLRACGYGDSAIDELLGDDAYETVLDDVPALARRLPDTPLAAVVRVLFLELPAPAAALEQALGRDGLLALEALGLAGVDEVVVPHTRLSPVGPLLIASDILSSDPSADPQDYVATYTPTSRICDFLTPRPRVARALDVGTGNGIHALLAARHAEHVVATDVNERALAYTQINAALNGLDNVECRRGSMFDPVEGERFGLITCNAPFVISPERRWTYRDGSLEGDALSELTVLGGAEHLDDGGFATLCVSWLGANEDEADERVLEWVEQTGCSAWVLALEEHTPLEHAVQWNAHLVNDADAYTAALDRWSSYVEDLDAGWVTEGAVLLHRAGAEPTIRVDDVDTDELDVADEQIRRAFGAREVLARLDGDLGERSLRAVASLRAEIELAPNRDPVAVVRLAEGTHPELDASPAEAEAVISLDGGGRIGREALELARELLELGALEFV